MSFNVTGKRSVNVLKIIKNYQIYFILLKKNLKLLESVDFDDLINTFTAVKSRKHQI